MWIFFRNLPRGMTLKEINSITRKGCRKGLQLLPLLQKNIVKRSKIIRIRDLKADSTEYHAIVQVDSAITADNIIDCLDGKTIKGTFISAHRYHRRFSSRDKRNSRLTDLNMQERRKGERRRSQLITRILETS